MLRQALALSRDYQATRSRGVCHCASSAEICRAPCSSRDRVRPKPPTVRPSPWLTNWMRPLLAHCHYGLGILYNGEATRAGRAELSAAIELYRAMEMALWLEPAEAMLAQMA